MESNTVEYRCGICNARVDDKAGKRIYCPTRLAHGPMATVLSSRLTATILENDHNTAKLAKIMSEPRAVEMVDR